MKESEIQNAIMTMLHKHPRVAWAFVTTTGTVKGRGGHWMRLGYTGMADILGQLRDGRLFAIEVKQPGKKPTEEQSTFLDAVKVSNGVSGWCDSVAGAIEILEGE